MITILILSACILGFLAFFEPCSIATHTLFAVKSYRLSTKQCYLNLLSTWLSRSILLVILFTAATFFISPPELNNYLASIALAVIAFIYLFSRFVYIPIPHLEFFKLLPYGTRLPHAIKLGLTLPACTLPLVVIVAGMSVFLGQLSLAVISAVLFSTLFTIPMLSASYKGLNENSIELLNRAAKGSPYLTAILLLSLALYLLVPSLEINIVELKQVLTEASWAGIGLAFLAGFVFSFNPVSFASVPVILAYVTKAHEEKRAILMGSAFVAGMISTHVVLGVIAALGGDWVQGIMGRHWGLLLGPVLILMGLMWSGWLTVRLPWFGVKAKNVSGFWGAFLLGIPFTVAVCPFCTPALLVTLTASAAIGSTGFGFALLLAFALGRSIPVILGAWGMGWLESLKILTRFQKQLEVIAGVILIITGLYLLNEYFFIINLYS